MGDTDWEAYVRRAEFVRYLHEWAARANEQEDEECDEPVIEPLRLRELFWGPPGR